MPSDTTLDQPRRAVLLGMGGQGKTQTAIRYCQKAFQHRTFNTVLWIDASSETSAHQAINSILSKAEIPTSALEVERNLISFKDALTSLKGPCLLVFDNYDSPRNFSKIADMFVHHEQICIMLTSRHHESLRLGTPVHVREMDQSDAEDLLLVSSGLIRQDINPKNLAKAVNMLGRLPLALDQAGAYIRKLHLSLDVFEEHYIDKQKEILQYTPDLFEYRKSLLPGSEPSVLSVFTTWDLSLEQLGDDRPHLEHLLSLSAFFDHNKVHEALFSTRCTINFTACSGIKDGWLHCMLTDSAWDSYRFQDIIANLHGLSLLQKFWVEDGHIVFSLHPLVNDWLRTRGEKKDRASMVVEAAVTVAGMDAARISFKHIPKCLQDLVCYEEALFDDCVDMKSSRTIANGAAVPKLVADELNPEPHHGQVEALYCPHGRPCQTIPSTIRLKNIMCRYLISLSLADVGKQLLRATRFCIGDQSSARNVDLYRYNNFIRVTSHYVDSLSNWVGELSKPGVPTLQKSCEATEGHKTLLLEDVSLPSGPNILIEEIATLRQQVENLSELKRRFKEADTKVKQMERIIDDGESLELSSETSSSLKACIAELLTVVKGIFALLSTVTQPSEFALVRKQLRSLPFLQSGF